MLKERIDYLCLKQNISRKELADGLITLSHLSNILLGRYALADDLAEKFAKKLHTTPNYLIKADDVSDEIVKQCDELLLQIILYKAEYTNVFEKLPEQYDSLILELVAILMKACYFGFQNNQAEYYRLHQKYLDYYLKEITDKTIVNMPIPLRKAYYFYMIQRYRNVQDFEMALSYLDELSVLYKMEPEIWLKLRKLAIETQMNTNALDGIQKEFDEMFFLVRKDNLLHHLTSLYIDYGAYCVRLGLLQTALVHFSYAEEYAIYLQNGIVSYLYPIYNNRIYIWFAQKKYAEAEKEILRFEDQLKKYNMLNENMERLLTSYFCEIALNMDRIDEAKEMIESFEENSNVEDQNDFIYYKAYIAYLQGNKAESEAMLLKCLPYFEKVGSVDCLTDVYKLLAKIFKDSGKYKRAVDCYEKIITLNLMK